MRELRTHSIIAALHAAGVVAFSPSDEGEIIEAKETVKREIFDHACSRPAGKSYPFSSTRQIERNKRQLERGQISFISHGSRA